jgi:hypothetical protein
MRDDQPLIIRNGWEEEVALQNARAAVTVLGAGLVRDSSMFIHILDQCRSHLGQERNREEFTHHHNQSQARSQRQ